MLERSSRAGALPMVRRAHGVRTWQSGGCAYHGQACTQCHNAAVGRVCLPWSGARAVLEGSSRAGALAMVRRACSVVTQQSGGRAYHGQACAQWYNEAGGRVPLPWSGVRAVL